MASGHRGETMKRIIILTVMGAGLLGLAACATSPDASSPDRGAYGSIGVGRTF